MILHLKAGKAGGGKAGANKPLSSLADKIFRLFDRAGTGVVNEEQVRRLMISILLQMIIIYLY